MEAVASMAFVTDKAVITARKPHRCTWCGQAIEKGEQHFMWKSVDDSWFTNRMHRECLDACTEECHFYGEVEYPAYQNERPRRL